MISQLLIARSVVAIAVGKATIFHCGLNGHRADITRWTLLDFSFSLLKKLKQKQKNKRPRQRCCQWRTMVRRPRCFIGRFSVCSASLKKFQTSWLAKHCLVLLFRQLASLYRSTVYDLARSNMHTVSVCFQNPPN